MAKTESKKYNQLVRTAEDLFKRYGMRRVTIGEICREAEVSKMTYYKYFRNKTEIIKTVINKIMDEAEREYRSLMEQDIPYIEKTKQIIQKKVEIVEEFSREFTHDILQSGDTEIIELMTERTRRNLEIFMNDFISAQKQGYVRSDIKPDFIIYIIESMKGMVADEVFLGLFDSSKEMTAELNNFFFYGILKREDDAET